MQYIDIYIIIQVISFARWKFSKRLLATQLTIKKEREKETANF